MIMAACVERFPRLDTELEQLASYRDDHDTSLETGSGVRVPCIVKQDEDGFWCASAQIRPGVAAFGDGTTREAALDDLWTAFDLLLNVVGPGS